MFEIAALFSQWLAHYQKLGKRLTKNRGKFKNLVDEVELLGVILARIKSDVLMESCK